MKIVAVSDLHNYYDKVIMPPGDILVVAGDVSGLGNELETKNFVEWFKKQKYGHKVFIAGNHDFFFEGKELVDINKFLQLGPNEHYLHDSGVEIEGINFWGSPWSNKFHNWAFMGTDEFLEYSVWAKIHENTEVLITHGPPWGTRDMNDSGDRCGSPSLTKRVAELKNVRVHIFGHIHEDYGWKESTDRNLLSVNASTCNIRYKPLNKPVVIEYVKGGEPIVLDGGRV